MAVKEIKYVKKAIKLCIMVVSRSSILRIILKICHGCLKKIACQCCKMQAIWQFEFKLLAYICDRSLTSDTH